MAVMAVNIYKCAAFFAGYPPLNGLYALICACACWTVNSTVTRIGSGKAESSLQVLLYGCYQPPS